MSLIKSGSKPALPKPTMPAVSGKMKSGHDNPFSTDDSTDAMQPGDSAEDSARAEISAADPVVLQKLLTEAQAGKFGPEAQSLASQATGEAGTPGDQADSADGAASSVFSGGDDDDEDDTASQPYGSIFSRGR
jgi:hypothetical protein